MAYTLYLASTQMPVAPSKLQLKIKNQNKTVTLINESEVNIIKSAGLTEITFDLLLPDHRYPFAQYPDGFRRAGYYLDRIEKLKTDEKPFQFIVTRLKPTGEPIFDTNMKVGLEDYTIKEDAKEGNDIVVTVKLKQYRDYGTKTIRLEEQNAVVYQPRPTGSPPQAKTYVVKRGDCLWNIAKRYLGKGSRYMEIYNLNKDKIKNPNLIYPGQVLTLPNP